MTRKTTIIVAGRKIDYILGSEGPRLLPAPPSLEDQTDPDCHLPGGPGLSDSKGNRQWPKPHSDYLRIEPEAVAAAAGGAYLPRLSRWLGTAASALDSGNLASRWLIRRERPELTVARALRSTRRRPSSFSLGRPASRQLQAAAGRSGRQAAAEPGLEPSAATASMARTSRLDAGEHGGTSRLRGEASVVPILAALLLTLGCVAALAQVPVQDRKREEKETSIARCVAKSQELKQQEMSPQKGVKASVASPGGVASLPANQMTGQGYAPLVGGGASSVPSGVRSMPGMPSVAASGSTASAVVSSVAGSGQGNPLGLGMGLVGAVGSSLNGGQSALTANVGLFQGLSGKVGTASGTQNGWDQNSQARVSNVQTWNQALGLTSITAQLWNQRLIGQTAGASAAAAATSYDPERAVFVPGAVPTPAQVNRVNLTPPSGQPGPTAPAQGQTSSAVPSTHSGGSGQ